MINLIKKLDDLLAKVEEFLLIVILIGLMGLGFLQVILRNFFESGFLWADVFLRHLVLWIGLIGASLATKQNKHLNMDALTRLFSPKTVAIISVFLNIVAAIISGVFVVAGYFFVKDEFEMGGDKMILLNVPIWVAQLIIPIAFTIITLRFLFKSLDLAVTLIKKGEDIVHKVERKTGPLLPEPEEGLNPKKKSEQGGEV